MSNRVTPYPFVKWVGGKTRMLKHILEFFPNKINTYYEPFVGGGSTFFELCRRGAFQNACIGDMNPDLVNAYVQIRDNVKSVIEFLRSDAYKYDKENYLRVRALACEDLTPANRAARFIYLNKTCFNGLYRVNQKGQFNVPFGKFTDPVVCDAKNLTDVSMALQKVDVQLADYAHVVHNARVGDVVYFDPPYFPKSKTSKFVNYTKNGFGLEEHEKLSGVFSTLAKRGVTVLLSNSYCPTTLDLYREFEIMELTGSRTVGGPAEYRKPVKEILVIANVRSTRESCFKPEAGFNLISGTVIMK